jgi:multimeric flavodoxin WrbA
MNRRLLVIHHSPTESTRRLVDAAIAGANHPDRDGAVDVSEIGALAASAADIRLADGVLLGTTVNFGYMSGALKHFFDSTYRDLIDPTRRLPAGLWVKGTTDASGAVRAILPIIGALDWRLVQAPLVIEGDIDPSAEAAAYELGATVAASLTS